MTQRKTSGFSPAERRAALSLSGIFSLRMLGLFLVLPVFSVYAQGLEGATPALIGFALGAYGLTQALLQVAFGMASDRLGRKPVITAGLLLFAAGSLMCAQAETVQAMIWGRMLQGSGAIAAAITAMMADLTREELRTRAMAMIGGGIALSFAFSMVAGPIIGARWGVDRIFYGVAVLSALSIPLLWLVVPTPKRVRHHRDTEVTTSDLGRVLSDPNLRRLDLGVFVLHMALTAVFVAVPPLLVREIPEAGLWKVYLPVILISFALMVPSTLVAEVKGKIREVVLCGVAALGLSCVIFITASGSFAGLVAGLLVFFVGFNMLEPVLPSLVTKFSPAGAKGTGSGVYNTFQFLGPFVGGTVGGLLMGHGPAAVFAFVLASVCVWLLVAWGMTAPIPYKQVVVPLKAGLNGKAETAIREALAALDGVGEVQLYSQDAEAHVRFVSKKVTVPEIFDTVRQAETGG